MQDKETTKKIDKQYNPEPWYYLTLSEIIPLLFALMIGGYALYTLGELNGNLAGLFFFPHLMLGYALLVVSLGCVAEKAFDKNKTFNSNSVLRIFLLIVLPMIIIWPLLPMLFGY